MDRLRFGTAGIPLRCKGCDTSRGIAKVREIGLDAMELEFVRGVNLSSEKAVFAAASAREHDVVLTAHAPYYINLNSVEDPKRKASEERIISSARVCHLAGGYSVVFHAGYYMKMSSESAYERIRDSVMRISAVLNDEGIDIWLRPETMGKGTQWGTIEEILRLSEDVEMVMPAVDFSHIHARYGGSFNTAEEFRELLSMIETHLGPEGLREMHCHVSGIEYGSRGEKRHLILEKSDMEYGALMEVMKEFDCRGVIISESPNIEEDALLLRDSYNTA